MSLIIWYGLITGLLLLSARINELVEWRINTLFEIALKKAEKEGKVCFTTFSAE